MKQRHLSNRFLSLFIYFNYFPSDKLRKVYSHTDYRGILTVHSISIDERCDKTGGICSSLDFPFCAWQLL